MFRKLLFILSIVVISNNSIAQNAVKWLVTSEKVENESATYLIQFHADIEDKWHLYSQNLPSPDAGPLPTLFEFDENENIELVGTVAEEKNKMHSVMDEAFGVQVNYFDGKVVFTQKVRLLSSDMASLSGFVSYMICSDVMCVPKDLEFSIIIGK